MRDLIDRTWDFAFETTVGRYCVLSGLSLVLNVGGLVLFHELVGLSKERDAVIATLLTVFHVNFAGLRYWVYTDSELGWWEQYWGYLLSIIGFRALEFLTYNLLVERVAIHYGALYFLVLLVSFVGKQTVHRLLVFRAAPEAVEVEPPDQSSRDSNSA